MTNPRVEAIKAAMLDTFGQHGFTPSWLESRAIQALMEADRVVAARPAGHFTEEQRRRARLALGGALLDAKVVPPGYVIFAGDWNRLVEALTDAVLSAVLGPPEEPTPEQIAHQQMLDDIDACDEDD